MKGKRDRLLLLYRGKRKEEEGKERIGLNSKGSSRLTRRIERKGRNLPNSLIRRGREG